MKQYEITPDGNQLVMYAWGKGSENSLQAFPLTVLNCGFIIVSIWLSNGVGANWTQFMGIVHQIHFHSTSRETAPNMSKISLAVLAFKLL